MRFIYYVTIWFLNWCNNQLSACRLQKEWIRCNISYASGNTLIILIYFTQWTEKLYFDKFICSTESIHLIFSNTCCPKIVTSIRKMFILFHVSMYIFKLLLIILSNLRYKCRILNINSVLKVKIFFIIFNVQMFSPSDLKECCISFQKQKNGNWSWTKALLTEIGEICKKIGSIGSLQEWSVRPCKLILKSVRFSGEDPRNSAVDVTNGVKEFYAINVFLWLSSFCLEQDRLTCLMTMPLKSKHKEVYIL